MFTKKVRTHLQAAKIYDDEVWHVAVETRLWYEKVRWFKVDPQIQDLPGLNDVGQACRDQSPS